MKAIILTIFFFFLLTSLSVYASKVELQWDANTETDLEGYRVYCSTASLPPFNIIAATPNTDIIIDLDLTTQGQYCAVTAYNTASLESPYSNIVFIEKDIITIPKPTIPQNLRVIKVIP